MLKNGSVLTEEELYNYGEKILEYEYTDITNELKKNAKNNCKCDRCYQIKIYNKEKDGTVGLSCCDLPITLNDHDNIIKNLEQASVFHYVAINDKLNDKIKFLNAE